MPAILLLMSSQHQSLTHIVGGHKNLAETDADLLGRVAQSEAMDKVT